jgi:diguanylate cyclase (GGDEF)-like protein/PAS domain S-box-containing protein
MLIHRADHDAGHQPWRMRMMIPLALTALFALIIGFNLGGEQFALYVDDVGELVAAAWAGWACIQAGRRAPARGRPWRMLGTGVLCWAAGEAVWSWLELVQHRSDLFPSLADVGFLAFVPLAIWAIACLAEAPAGLLSKLRGIMEAALVGSALLYLSWIAVLDQIYHDTTQHLSTRAVSLAYPGGDIVVAVVALMAISRATRRGQSSLAWVGFGALALALSDSAFAYLSQTGAYGATQLIDAGWVLGFVLIGTGATRSRAVAVPVAEDDLRPPSRLALLAPFAMVSPAIALRMHLLSHGLQDLDRQVIYMVMVCALLANIIVVLLENHSLMSTLDARVHARSAEVRTAERRLFTLVQDLSEVVLVCDADYVVRYASDSAGQVLGRSPADLAGSAITAVAAGRDKEHLLAAVRQAAEQGAPSSIDFTLAGSTPGDERFAQARVRNMLDEPAINGLVINLRDVTENTRLADDLRTLALRDSLTGLPNRTLFLDRVDLALARCRREGTSVWVGIIDLDDFKNVNDSLGHQAGDELLRMVSSRFDPCLRANDTVARLGGDEFALLIESSMVEPDVLAQRLLDSLAAPFDIAGQEVYISASIGLAPASPTDERDELLRQADTAMYAAKRTGRGRFTQYEPAMQHEAVARLELESDLKRALERGQLRLAYQPTVAVASGEVLGFEALLRWDHPERGPVSPAEFIPVAEASGAIIPIGRWVLEQACRQAASWQRPDRPVSVNVNVSVVQLRTGNVVADVDAALAASGLDPRRLVVELTESVLLDDGPVLVGSLYELRTRGVRVAIDDFGTGYSSLAYLQRLPVDILKIDKAFVDHLGEGGQAEGMVRAIVELAATLSADAVAEGVERIEQAEGLRAIGCHAAQGYLFARPLTASAATTLVQQGGSLLPVADTAA